MFVCIYEPKTKIHSLLWHHAAKRPPLWYQEQYRIQYHSAIVSIFNRDSLLCRATADGSLQPTATNSVSTKTYTERQQRGGGNERVN